jgi:hypothetical protein
VRPYRSGVRSTRAAVPTRPRHNVRPSQSMLRSCAWPNVMAGPVLSVNHTWYCPPLSRGPLYQPAAPSESTTPAHGRARDVVATRYCRAGEKNERGLCDHSSRCEGYRPRYRPQNHAIEFVTTQHHEHSESEPEIGTYIHLSHSALMHVNSMVAGALHRTPAIGRTKFIFLTKFDTSLLLCHARAIDRTDTAAALTLGPSCGAKNIRVVGADLGGERVHWVR